MLDIENRIIEMKDEMEFNNKMINYLNGKRGGIKAFNKQELFDRNNKLRTKISQYEKMLADMEILERGLS